MAVFDDNTVMLPVGTMLHERYRIERYLASGGFGNTYMAHDTLFDETVVVKEFFMRTVSQRDAQSLTVSVGNPTNRPSFDSQLRKFRIEAKRVRKLKNDHIVHVHDLFDEFGTSYYVMDYIDGESLNVWLKRRGAPFDENTVRYFLDQMLDALSEPHRHSIWHLDVKPGNMMLSRDGKLTLIDFGASKMTDQSGDHSTSSMMAYTAGYAPIEQIEQRIDAIGAHTDLYALGASLYNLLTNQRPPERSLIDDEGDNAFRYPANVSVPMRQLIRYMMQPLRRNRPQSIEQVRQFIAANHLEPSARLVAPAPKVVDDDVVVIREAPQPRPQASQPIAAAGQTLQQEKTAVAPKVPVTPAAAPAPVPKPAPKPVAQVEPTPQPVKPVAKAEPTPQPVKPAPKAESTPKPVKPAAKAEPASKPVLESKPEPSNTDKKSFKKVAAAIVAGALLAVIAAAALNRCNSDSTTPESEGVGVPPKEMVENIETTIEPVAEPEPQPAPAGASEHSRVKIPIPTKPDAMKNKTVTPNPSTKNNQSKDNLNQQAQKALEKQQPQKPEQPKPVQTQPATPQPKPVQAQPKQSWQPSSQPTQSQQTQSGQRQRHEPQK